MFVELDVTVSQPLEKVFDTLADLRNEPAWNPEVAEVELLTGEPVDGDSRFSLMREGMPFDATLRRHQRPHLLEITTTGAQLTTRSVLAFMEGAAGTVVIVRLEHHLRGPRKLLEPFLVRSLRRELGVRLAAFRLYCES